MEFTGYHVELAGHIFFLGIIGLGLRNHSRASIICAFSLSAIGGAFLIYNVIWIMDSMDKLNANKDMFVQTLMLQKTPITEYLHVTMTASYAIVFVSIELYILYFVNRFRNKFKKKNTN